jgi:hypothetical protein
MVSILIISHCEPLRLRTGSRNSLRTSSALDSRRGRTEQQPALGLFRAWTLFAPIRTPWHTDQAAGAFRVG